MNYAKMLNSGSELHILAVFVCPAPNTNIAFIYERLDGHLTTQDDKKRGVWEGFQSLCQNSPVPFSVTKV